MAEQLQDVPEFSVWEEASAMPQLRRRHLSEAIGTSNAPNLTPSNSLGAALRRLWQTEGAATEAQTEVAPRVSSTFPADPPSAASALEGLPAADAPGPASVTSAPEEVAAGPTAFSTAPGALEETAPAPAPAPSEAATGLTRSPSISSLAELDTLPQNNLAAAAAHARLPLLADQFDADMSGGVSLSGDRGTYNHLTDAILDVPETRSMYMRRLRTLMDEFLNGKLVNIIQDEYTKIRSAALQDDAKWGAGNIDIGYRYDTVAPDLVCVIEDASRGVPARSVVEVYAWKRLDMSPLV